MNKRCFQSQMVRDCTRLWFVNAFLPVFIVMATALFLLLSPDAVATLATEPKKAPYAIAGILLCDAHRENVEWMRFIEVVEG